MNSTRRPPKPEDVSPRRIADASGRALHEQMGKPPEGNFADGVEAYLAYRKRMTPDMGDMWELGPHIEPVEGRDRDDRGDSVHLDGVPPRPIAFPVWWRRWFAKQNERTLRILDKIIEWLDEHGEEEAGKRLADLDEVVARHRARRVLVARLKWVTKFGGPAAGLTWGALTFAQDKIGRVIEQLPVLRAAWKAILGSTS